MLHVVVAVIRDKNQQILIAQRAAQQHQGGKWEFPGGKVEAGETPQHALARELDEELGIQIEAPRPLIQIRHHYPDLSVFLDVYEVTQWQGDAYGKEGQPIRWVAVEEVARYPFPVANKPILQALILPELCLITPEIDDEESFQAGIKRCLEDGIRLIQFRAKTLSAADYSRRAHWLLQYCQRYQTRVVFNSPPDSFAPDALQGLHLTSRQLLTQTERPPARLVSAACHNAEELSKAQAIGVDFVFLSPIHATRSHPEAQGQGWQWFNTAIETVNLPVYALGGLHKNELEMAKAQGAQGIAAISGLWGEGG